MDGSYLRPYRDAVQEHGSDFKATLWATPKTQRLRFRVFTEMAFFAGKRVLDAGCSRGDFAAYLLEHDQPYQRYIGIDGMPEVIDHARQRGLPHAEFHAGDFVTHPDLLRLGDPQIITLSGTLNTMDDRTVFQLLDHAWEAAGQALLFNFLSDRVSPKAPPQGYPARRLPTLALIDWALGRTHDVHFRQDYFPNGHDATLLMHKPG